MPIPINLNNSNSDGNHYVDYSFLENLGLESSFTPAPAAPKNVVTASNQDAASLYKLWERSDNSLAGEFDLNEIKESTDLSARDITRLKTMGFISESSNKVKITERGRKVLVTMTLSEPNNFQLKAQKKPYNEILAGMDRKKKGGLRCASYATNNNNCLDLRKLASDISNWDRFKDLIDLGTWDEVVEAGFGDPTSEESRAIERLGYYGKNIDEESIDGLKRGESYKEGLKLILSGPEGSSSVSFESKKEMKKYIEDRLGADARNITDNGFGTDYVNYHLEGATMSDLGIDILGSKPVQGETEWGLLEKADQSDQPSYIVPTPKYFNSKEALARNVREKLDKTRIIGHIEESGWDTGYGSDYSLVGGVKLSDLGIDISEYKDKIWKPEV